MSSWASQAHPFHHMSKTVLTAPLERSTCPYHRSLLSFRMRSRSSMPSHTSSSLDLVVTMSCGLTLQICLIIALSFHCRRWRFGFVNSQVSLAWSIVLCTQELYTRPHVLKERWRIGSRSLNFFQAVFTRMMILIKMAILWLQNKVLMLSIPGKNFSSQHFEIFFLFSQENKDEISYKLSPKETRRQFACNEKACFLVKMRQILSVCHLLNLPTEW